MLAVDYSPKFKLILFDLDGTLVNTLPELTDAINDTLPQRYGTEPCQNDLVQSWIGNGAANLLKLALNHVGVEPSMSQKEFELVWPEFQEAYAKRCGTNSSVYPGVTPCLSALKKSGYRMAVLTNKESLFAQKVISDNGMSHFFESIIAGDSFEYKKPDPRVMTLSLEQFNLNKQDVLFVGDSMIDIETGVSSGVETWAVSYGYNHGEFDAASTSSIADRLIDDFDQLRRLLTTESTVNEVRYCD